MRRLLLLSLLLICTEAVAHESAEARELDVPLDASSTGISISRFQRILRTEASAPLKTRRLSASESNDLWEKSIQHEWSLARNREEKIAATGRALQDDAREGFSPFVVCDMEYGKTGEQSLTDLQNLLGLSLMPVYNRVDMACFAMYTSASSLSSLPPNIEAVPMTPEMKIGEGTADFIASSNPSVSRVEARMCVEENLSEEGQDSFSRVYDRIISTSGERRLRAVDYLDSRRRRDTEQGSVWYESVLALDGEECQAMLELWELDTTGSTLMLTLPDEFLAEAPRDCILALVADLAMQPEVCFVGAFKQIQTSNNVASGIVQSGRAGSKPFYDVGLDGSGQVVAVSDTGVDLNNCYFWDRDSPTPRGRTGRFDLDVRKVVQYYNFVDAADEFEGHGSHVAGSVAGRRAPDGRTESDGAGDGVARAAKLAIMDIGDSSGNLRTPPVTTLLGTGYEAGARIHSASWGSPDQNSYSTYDASIDEVLYNTPDLLFVVAAGNDGRGNRRNSVSSPAVAKNGISVGATQNEDPHIYWHQKGPDYLAEFSSRGPTSDGRMKPDVVAPGQMILSARAAPNAQGECDNTAEQGLFFNAGTSMATPIVSGTAALVRQYFVDGWYPSGRPNESQGFSPRASLVKAVLLNGGSTLLGIDPEARFGRVTSSTAYDVNQGFGRVNLLSSLPLAGKNSIRAIFSNGAIIGNGETASHDILITANACSEPLSATLVWTDPPGAPNCEECLLNDLDLYLTRNGSTSRLFPNGRSSADTLNNAERVRVENPMPGDRYTINVEASDLLGRQEYSLIVTGCFDEVSGGGDSPTNAPSASGSEAAVESDESCVDGSQIVTVDNTRAASCGVLAGIIVTEPFLCTFLDIALECPVLCSICPLLSRTGEATVDRPPAETSLSGANRWYGQMFEVEAKKDIIIDGFDLHMNGVRNYRIEVSQRPGTLTSTGGSFRSMCDVFVQGSGYGQITRLPAGACTPLRLNETDVHTFYVTTRWDEMVMSNERGQIGTTAFENDDLRVGSGVAVTYPNAGTFNGYSFNGAIQYKTVQNSEQQCMDKSGSVLIDAFVGEETCLWLARYLDRFSFVCERVDVAFHCPATCGICEQIGRSN